MSETPSPTPSFPGRAQTLARIALSLALLGLGLFILSGFLKALVWALVLGTALWPAYARARRRLPPKAGHDSLLPALATGLVAVVFMLPVALLAFEAAREAHDLLSYFRRAEDTGIPVPAFVARLPFGAEAVSAWWNAHLAHGGWAHELLERLNTASNRDLTRAVGVGVGVVHRLVLFLTCLLALFFLFRDGDALIEQSLTASHRLFGPRGERIARQMMVSVHGTVDGLVLVGIGEGVALGIVYWLTGVPHPILFGAATAVAAIIPFGAPLAFGIAAILLLAQGALSPALVVVAAGLVVTFVADHFVRPSVIGGVTRLPFLWVLLGILGGLETLGLLGLFVGPAVMAALILLWRELTEDRRETTMSHSSNSPAPSS